MLPSIADHNAYAVGVRGICRRMYLCPSIHPYAPNSLAKNSPRKRGCRRHISSCLY
jgi:hypothetical protein